MTAIVDLAVLPTRLKITENEIWMIASALIPKSRSAPLQREEEVH